MLSPEYNTKTGVLLLLQIVEFLAGIPETEHWNLNPQNRDKEQSYKPFPSRSGAHRERQRAREAESAGRPADKDGRGATNPPSLSAVMPSISFLFFPFFLVPFLEVFIPVSTFGPFRRPEDSLIVYLRPYSYHSILPSENIHPSGNLTIQSVVFYCKYPTN